MSVRLTVSEGKRFFNDFQHTSYLDCNDCTVPDDVKYRFHVKARGRFDAPIVIVGEAPGEKEEELLRAFVGPAGIRLVKELKAIGIDADRDTYITNTVKCRPLGNRNPTSKECRVCREKFLVNEIKLFPRKLIIALGNFGYYGVVPKGSPSGITKRCGMFEENEEFGCYVLPCLHPAAVIRDLGNEPLMKNAFRKAKQFINNDYSIPTQKPVKYKEIYDLGTFWDLITEVRKRKRFVIDLETTGFSWITDSILCMSFSTKSLSAWYLPLVEDEQWIWCASDWAVIEEGLKEIFEDPSIAKIGFNVKFDFKFLIHHFGWDIQGYVDDPMLMHHLLQENTPHGLKLLANRYTAMGNYSKPLEDAFNEVKRSRIDKKDKHYGKISSEILKLYAMMDADATFRVYEKFLNSLRKEHFLFAFYRKGVMPVMPVLMEMELMGIRIDKELIQRLETETCQELTDIENSVNEIAGYELNIASTKQLSELLFTKMGYTPLIQGKNYPSTKETVLKELHEKTGDEIFEILLNHRAMSKLLGTYITGMIKRIAPDGRIHTSYLQHGTVTGRLSSAGPNLQNIPRESVVKNIFVPTLGFLLISADYSQHEVRMWANYSQDPMLLEALATGDVHSNIGSVLLEKSPDEITKDERVFVKGVVFGLMYGRGTRSLSDELGDRLKRRVSEEEAGKFVRMFFDMFPVATHWLETQEKFAMKNGYVRNRFGRIRHLPEAFSKEGRVIAEARRNARNSPIQSLASDVTNIALERISKAFKREGLGARLLLQVHDELLAEAPIDQIGVATEVMAEQMLRPINGIDLPLAIEMEVVNCWGGEPVEYTK